MGEHDDFLYLSRNHGGGGGGGGGGWWGVRGGGRGGGGGGVGVQSHPPPGRITRGNPSKKDSDVSLKNFSPGMPKEGRANVYLLMLLVVGPPSVGALKGEKFTRRLHCFRRLLDIGGKFQSFEKGLYIFQVNRGGLSGGVHRKKKSRVLVFPV